MQFGFAHRPLEAQEQAVIKLTGVIQTVLVKNKGSCQPANLQEPMPVGTVARQTRNLQPHHDASLAQADIGHQSLKALPVGGRGSRLALVVVDDDDLLFAPAQRQGAAAQVVLPLGALGVFHNLPQGRLPDVKISGALQMFVCDFRFGIHIQ